MTSPTCRELLSSHACAHSPWAPFVLARGQGSWVWDTDGRRYLDFATGIGVNALGHAHPDVVAAIVDQASQLSHTSNLYAHEPYAQLCARLCELSFGERVFLCSSGTEAIEAALKAALRFFVSQKRPRHHFVGTEGSFHGRTLGALSVTGQPAYRAGYEPVLGASTFVPFGDIEAMRAAVSPRTAAVVVEPVQGNGGVVVAPPGYLAALRQICDAHGALLVFDEVQTGIGRCGAWFAHQNAGIEPDIMALAKAVGGGLPLGAAVLTAPVAAALTAGTHGTTFGGNALACRAGLATLETIAREELLGHALRLGEAFTRRMSASAEVLECRGQGAMLGVQVRNPKAVRRACQDAGLLVTTAGPDVVRVLPPLNATLEEMEQACDILDHVLTSQTETSEAESHL